MSTYQIQGTVSLFKQNGSDLKVRLIPANNYVNPDKKYAVFFPISPEDELTALMKKIKDKAIEMELPLCDDVRSALIAAASSQKLIQLDVDCIYKVIGFTYPSL